VFVSTVGHLAYERTFIKFGPWRNQRSRTSAQRRVDLEVSFRPANRWSQLSSLDPQPSDEAMNRMPESRHLRWSLLVGSGESGGS
jgi:hypothetical protein